MSTPRRRIIRPQPPAPATDARRQRRLERLRANLEKERQALARWKTRLRRAFRAVEKHTRNVLRLEKQIHDQEE
jgi:hypothetical protein